MTTDRGYTRDYFGDMAWYCDPYDNRSIRRAVEAAHAAPVCQKLRDHVLANFTWAHTAAETLKAYHRVLAVRCGELDDNSDKKYT